MANPKAKWVRNKKGKVIAPFPFGRFPGHLTKAKKLWNHLSLRPRTLPPQSDRRLAAKMAVPKPMEGHEIHIARKAGLTVEGGYVVPEKV